MDSSFPRSIEGKSGEKLLQGLLAQALIMDPAFLRAFCQWLGFEGNPDNKIEMEYKRPDNTRMDIAIFFKDQKEPKGVELKIFADSTSAQREKDKYCDALIAPDNHLKFIEIQLADKFKKSWQEFYKEFKGNQTVKALFSGLEDYIGCVRELNLERVKTEFSEGLEPKDGFWKIWGFLKELAGKIESAELQLKTGHVRGSQKFSVHWYGMSIYHSENTKNPYRLWIGFLYSQGFEGPYADRPHLVLQWPDGLKNCPENHLRNYNLSGENMRDIDIGMQGGWRDLLTVKDTWKVLEPLLKRY